LYRKLKWRILEYNVRISGRAVCAQRLRNAARSPLIKVLVTCVAFFVALASSAMLSQSASTFPDASLLTRISGFEPSRERVIWQGKSAGALIRWTNKDLYVEQNGKSSRLWGPLAEKGYQQFVTAQRDDEEVRSAQPNCDYVRCFKVLSVVGSLLSFQDGYYGYCGGAHPEANTRFTTIDVVKQGDIDYTTRKDEEFFDIDFAKQGRVVRLTDYFGEQDILKALLADPVMKKAIAELGTHPLPRTLADLPTLFEREFYGLGYGNAGFELRPDFLTRFAFHHVEGDKVAVRIGLPPHFGFNKTQHRELGIVLPIPESLRGALALADGRRQGFLMKDSRGRGIGKSNTCWSRSPKRSK
jgi:hypothetical protein